MIIAEVMKNTLNI